MRVAQGLPQGLWWVGGGGARSEVSFTLYHASQLPLVAVTVSGLRQIRRQVRQRHLGILPRVRICLGFDLWMFFPSERHRRHRLRSRSSPFLL